MYKKFWNMVVFIKQMKGILWRKLILDILINVLKKLIDLRRKFSSIPINNKLFH